MKVPLDLVAEPQLDHVAIAVHDLEAASGPYLLLGLVAEEEELIAEQGVRVRMLSSGSNRLELLEPTGPETPVGRFLAKRGQGLHHVALRVVSLDSEVERLQAAGVRFAGTGPRPGHAGSRVIFVHPESAAGVLVELVEREAAGG